MRTYEGFLTKLPKNGVFVFGSNTEGIHGKGSALAARKYFGAIPGQSFGLQGRSFAIYTKNLRAKFHPSVPPGEIINQIQQLYMYAEKHRELDFYVAYKGSGINLNGYTPQEMAEMFSASPRPDNMVFEKEFSDLLFL